MVRTVKGDLLDMGLDRAERAVMARIDEVRFVRVSRRMVGRQS